MPKLDLVRLVGIADALLIPIQKVIALVLPDFLENQLDKEEVREKIVVAVDKQLISAYPEARLVPEAMRKRLIRRTLDMMLDEILLTESN